MDIKALKMMMMPGTALRVDKESLVARINKRGRKCTKERMKTPS